MTNFPDRVVSQDSGHRSCSFLSQHSFRTFPCPLGVAVDCWLKGAQNLPLSRTTALGFSRMSSISTGYDLSASTFPPDVLGTALPGFRSCNPPWLRLSKRTRDHMSQKSRLGPYPPTLELQLVDHLPQSVTFPFASILSQIGEICMLKTHEICQLILLS